MLVFKIIYLFNIKLKNKNLLIENKLSTCFCNIFKKKLLKKLSGLTNYLLYL